MAEEFRFLEAFNRRKSGLQRIQAELNSNNCTFSLNKFVITLNTYYFLNFPEWIFENSQFKNVNLTRLNRQAAIDGASISAQAAPVPAALGSMEYLTPDTASTQSVVTRLVSHPLM